MLEEVEFHGKLEEDGVKVEEEEEEEEEEKEEDDEEEEEDAGGIVDHLY